MVQTMTYMAR